MTAKLNKARSKKTSIAVTPGDAQFAAAFEDLVGEVMLLNGRFMSVAAELSANLEVTPTQWQAVVVAATGRPRTVSQYARRLGVQRQTMQYTINGLVKRRFMEFTHNPDHRRSPLIRLTADGNNLVTELRHREVELCRRFTDGLDLAVTDVTQLRKSLRVLRLNAVGLDDQE